jgi:tripartite-type tricarboxylate transporter receptor subunit TctC
MKIRSAFFLLLAALVALEASAQAYPNRPIKLMVGFPPGGSADVVARVVADELSRQLEMPVVVDNKAGAGGNIAWDALAKAAADGYTVLTSTDGAPSMALYKNTAFSDKDFAGVSRISRGTVLVIVNKDSAFKNLKDVIDYAKANPGKLFNASAGYGSSPHLASVLFESVAGVKFTSVQYKGGAPATQSLMGGETQINFATSATVMGFVRAGRVRALAVSTRQASPSVPGVPGAEEAGLPGYDFNFSFGLYVPAATPRDIVRRLHAAALKGLSKPEAREKIALQGMDVALSASPEVFDKEVRAEAPYWENLVRKSGAKVE